MLCSVHEQPLNQQEPFQAVEHPIHLPVGKLVPRDEIPSQKKPGQLDPFIARQPQLVGEDEDLSTAGGGGATFDSIHTHIVPRVPRAVSYGGSFDEMPLAVQRAARVPRDYYDKALCRDVDENIRIAWIAEPKVRYKFGTQRILGSVLNEFALETCRMCPVQWECAATALEADEAAGIWSDTLDNLRLLRNRPDVLAKAKKRGVPVQDAVRKLVMS